MSSLPVLKAPRRGVPFKLYIAAEDKNVGAVLTQETKGKEHVVTCINRRLIDAETWYTCKLSIVIILLNICKLSIVIILLRFSQSIPYCTFHMCWVHWYEKFSSFMGESLVSLISNLLKTSYYTLFFVWVFFPLGFSYKVFNEVISTKDYVLSSIFSIEVFGGWYWNIRYIVLFSLCEFFLLRFLI